MIKCQDSLSFLKEQADCSADIIFSDVPYMLGSEIIIRPNGRPDYSSKGDFMGKWTGLSGKDWEEFYKEAWNSRKNGKTIKQKLHPNRKRIRVY